MMQTSVIDRARASGGVSSDVIYERIFQTVSPPALTAEVLDLGCGQGHFTHFLANRYGLKKIRCVDIIEPGDLPSGAIFQRADLQQSLPFENSIFDYIFAIEIIEHLTNPRFFMQEISRLLRPGGLAVVTTPVNESLRGYASLLVKGHYWAFCEPSYPAHITALLEVDLKRIVKETGMEFVAIHYTGSGGIPAMPHIKWQTILGRWAAGRLFSDNLVMVARKP